MSSRILHASTSLLRSQSQFLQLVHKVKEIAHDHVLLFSLSHDCPDLETAVKELGGSAKETIGCLSGPLPLQSNRPFFSCSVAVIPRDGCISFSVRQAGLPPTQIGRWHSYSGGKPVDDGSESIGDDMLSTIEGWKESTKEVAGSRFLPDELREAR